MDTRLKQRVIGATVLTAVAVIILPMLLDGSAEHRAQVEASIPTPPEIEITSLTVEQTRRKMTDMAEASEAKLPLLVEDTLEDPDETKNFSLNTSGLPVSWSLQLGSFKEQSNATRLRQKLRESDYRSYILNGEAGDALYRVYVGPMVNKDKLEKAKSEIEATMELSGRLVRYRIENDQYQLGG